MAEGPSSPEADASFDLRPVLGSETQTCWVYFGGPGTGWGRALGQGQGCSHATGMGSRRAGVCRSPSTAWKPPSSSVSIWQHKAVENKGCGDIKFGLVVLQLRLQTHALNDMHLLGSF